MNLVKFWNMSDSVMKGIIVAAVIGAIVSAAFWGTVTVMAIKAVL